MIIKTWDENCNLRAKLRLAPADIEEAIARCGWMILNDADDVSADDRREIARLEARGYASMTTQPGPAALAWWTARKVS